MYFIDNRQWLIKKSRSDEPQQEDRKNSENDLRLENRLEEANKEEM